MFDKFLIEINEYQITFGILINYIVVISLFILLMNLFKRLRIMFDDIICEPEIECEEFNPYKDDLWSNAEYEDKINLLNNCGLLSKEEFAERYYDEPIDVEQPVTVTHATVCTQCGYTFKLARDGTGRCPACGTYYSPVEVK